MEKKKKIIIGVIAAVVLCLGLGGGYLLSKDGGIDELLEETGLSKNSKKNKDAKKGDASKDDGVDAGAAGGTPGMPETAETRRRIMWIMAAPV